MCPSAPAIPPLAGKRLVPDAAERAVPGTVADAVRVGRQRPELGTVQTRAPVCGELPPERIGLEGELKQNTVCKHLKKLEKVEAGRRTKGFAQNMSMFMERLPWDAWLSHQVCNAQA